jgi:hypothetical protein
MKFELEGALKKYRRMRSWRRAGKAIVSLGAVTAPWLLNLGRTGHADLLSRRVHGGDDQRTRNATENDPDQACRHERSIERT